MCQGGMRNGGWEFKHQMKKPKLPVSCVTCMFVHWTECRSQSQFWHHHLSMFADLNFGENGPREVTKNIFTSFCNLKGTRRLYPRKTCNLLCCPWSGTKTRATRPDADLNRFLSDLFKDPSKQQKKGNSLASTMLGNSVVLEQEVLASCFSWFTVQSKCIMRGL